MLATAGTVAHCTQAEALLDGIAVGHLLADRDYDTNRVLAAAREYDAESCQALHLVGNGFGKLKERRGDALCAECGFVPGDMPDTHPGAVGQNNLVTRPNKAEIWNRCPLLCIWLPRRPDFGESRNDTAAVAGTRGPPDSGATPPSPASSGAILCYNGTVAVARE